MGSAQVLRLELEYVAVNPVCLAGVALADKYVAEGGRDELEYQDRVVAEDRFHVLQEVLELAAGFGQIPQGS
jgi:hypothetical protein